jgi:hypothetical protein
MYSKDVYIFHKTQEEVNTAVTQWCATWLEENINGHFK